MRAWWSYKQAIPEMMRTRMDRDDWGMYLIQRNGLCFLLLDEGSRALDRDLLTFAVHLKSGQLAPLLVLAAIGDRLGLGVQAGSSSSAPWH